MAEPHLPRRCGAEPLSDFLHSEAARAGFRPDNRQTKLQRRNTAPGLHEISLLAQLHFRRTRRMVRNDEIDGAVAQGLPKPLAILTLANRRTTFEFSCAAGNVFSCKMKIVRTSLDRYWQAKFLCRSQGRKGV